MPKLSAEGSRKLPIENYMSQAPALTGQAPAQAKAAGLPSVSGDEQGANPRPTKAMNPQRGEAPAPSAPRGPQSLHDMADSMHPVKRRR